MLSYEGIFFEGENAELIHSLEKQPLPFVNDEIHCTFKYHPNDDEIFDQLVGKEFDVWLVGYGCDGENSGFEIQLPDEISRYYINYEDDSKQKLKIPHITASLSEGATPSNTRKLTFERLPEPIRIRGKFGYWIKEEDREYISYDPYNKTISGKALK